MAMRGGRFLTIGALLRLLLGVMLSVLVAAPTVPTWTAIQQQDAATKAVAVTRVGQSLFTALQFLRPERGSVHAALDAPAPADAALLANVAALRSNAAPAIDAVLRDCAALGGATTDHPQIDMVLRSSVGRLLAMRQEVDAALRVPRVERPPGLLTQWDTASTDATTRLDRVSAALTERIRLVDAPIAELMAIKQLGWIVRDNAGLKRNLYSDAMNAKSLSVDLLTRIAAYRGKIEAGWGAVRELTARQRA